MAIGQRIGCILRERGISQNKLAKMAGLSQSGMSSILSGASRPREDTLQAIAKALGIPISELMDEPDTKKEPAVSGRLDDQFSSRIALLSPENKARMEAYLDGLLAAQDAQVP